MSEGASNPRQRQFSTMSLFQQSSFKYHTNKGTKFMMLAFVFIIIYYIMSIIYYNFIFYGFNDVYFSVTDLYFYFIFYLILFFFLLLFIIFVLISLWSFNLGRYEFGPGHQNNLSWAKAFLISYVIIYLGSILIFPVFMVLPFTLDEFYYILLQMFSIINGFFLGLGILLLVRAFAKPLQKDLLYIFSFFMILLPIIGSVIIVLRLTGIFAEAYYGPSVFLIVSDIIYLVIWLLALISYNSISKSLILYGQPIPPTRKGILPRPKPIAYHMNNVYSHPMNAFFGIMLITFLLGMGMAYGTEPCAFKGTESKEVQDEDCYDFEVVDAQERFSGSLREGDSEEFQVLLDAPIIYYCAELIWEDEPDEKYRYNNPDQFTLDTTVGELSDEISERNPHGEMCVIRVIWEFNIEKPLECDSAATKITLDNAGDQTGPLGLNMGPFKIDDFSNDYELVVSYTCIQYF